MKLYHGTSESRLKKILAHGLKPRHMTGKTNWKHTIESNPEAVYLTDAYPLYFAMNCSNDKEKWVVIEVDTDLLDESKLHPDEDVLEQAGRKYDGLPAHWSMNRRTRHYRKLAINNPNWKTSLEIMGTCAYYGTIPPKAITRVVLFDNEKYDVQFRMGLIDCSISLLNYRFCADRYRAITQWLFGKFDESIPERVYGSPFEAFGETGEYAKKFWTEQLKNREGIQIINLTHPESRIITRCDTPSTTDMMDTG